MKAVISIIIPFYNSEKTLRNCVLSVHRSDFNKPYELIVVDDGSTDKSIYTIKDLPVHVLRQTNKGAAAARNYGAKHSSSNLLLFVDSDVEYLPNTLNGIYCHLIKPDVDYVSVRYSRQPLNCGWISKYKALADYCYYYDFLFTKQQKESTVTQAAIGGGTEGYKRKAFEEIGGFDESVRGAGVEQEINMAKLIKDYHMLADGHIMTRHHFPGFRKLCKDYWTRTVDSMSVIINNHLRIAYLLDNRKRVFLGALSTGLLPLSVIFFLRQGNRLFLLPFALTFLSYLVYHFNMFVIAKKDNGFFFMCYSLLVNLFFCSLISIAGGIGLLRNLIKHEKGSYNS